MTDFVLVHGAWGDEGRWQRVRDLLDIEGNRVFTPTLAGPDSGACGLAPKARIERYVTDIANLLIREDLRGVVLVGHSEGVAVISRVADRLPDRIRSLVYLEAFAPGDDKILADDAPDAARRLREDGVDAADPTGAQARRSGSG